MNCVFTNYVPEADALEAVRQAIKYFLKDTAKCLDTMHCALCQRNIFADGFRRGCAYLYDKQAKKANNPVTFNFSDAETAFFVEMLVKAKQQAEERGESFPYGNMPITLFNE